MLVEPTSDSFRDLMSNWATGVSVVTTYHHNEPAGCTVSSLTSVSLEPPLLLIGLAVRSRMFQVLKEARYFCVNILAAEQADLSAAFASADPRERFAGVETSRVLNAPLIHGCLANAVCEVHTELIVGDRVLVVGQPLRHMLDTSRRPLVLFRRRDIPVIADQMYLHGANAS